MDQATEAMLRELATKMGVTVEFLWGTLVAQAPIYGVSCLLMYLLYIPLIYAHKRVLKWTDEFNDPTDATFARGASWVIVGMFTVAGVTQLPLILAAFFNPNYWALQHLLKLMRAAS